MVDVWEILIDADQKVREKLSGVLNWHVVRWDHFLGLVENFVLGVTKLHKLVEMPDVVL